MAEQKKKTGKAPVERKVISADEAKRAAAAKKKSTQAAVAEEAPAQAAAPAAKQEPAPAQEQKSGGSSGGLRVGAIVLWVVAVLFEVAAVLLLNRTLSLPGSLTTWLIVAIAADLVCVIVGSQLWKKANRITPASEKNKFKFWLWNNLGVIVSVVAFFPLVILLLRNKELDGKTKKIVTIIAACALLIAGGASYDFDPVSQEEQEAMKAEALENMSGDGQTVYWTPFGKSYHLDPDCQALRNSATLVTGTIDEAFEAKRYDPCDFCAGGADAAQDAADADGAQDADAAEPDEADEGEDSRQAA